MIRSAKWSLHRRHRSNGRVVAARRKHPEGQSDGRTVLLVDSNARLGSVKPNAVGSCEAEEHHGAGGAMHKLLLVVGFCCK